MTNASHRLPRSARPLLILSFLTCAPSGNAQEKQNPEGNYRASIQQQLAFENSVSEGVPDGWSGSAGTVDLDRKIVHSGQAAVRFVRDAQSNDTFSVITKSIPIDFVGSYIQLRGYLKTSNVEGTVGLWMREDGTERALQFDNMQSHRVEGTTSWTEYAVTLPIDRRANRLFFGVLLNGTGTAWADDLRLLIDGVPITETVPAERASTVIESDHEFANGSGIQIASLSETQIENLTILGRVWGFLKYHHPAVTAGKRQWDFDLYRILPAVLRATATAGANDVLADWIDTLGPISDCNACTNKQTSDIQSDVSLAWIDDETLLGLRLSKSLSHIYRNRVANQQFYVQLAPRVGNPDFGQELGYEGTTLPDAGMQLLALYRCWNIIEYWYPYRDVIGENWADVLKRSISDFVLAKDNHAYQLALLKLIANVHDTHANLWSAINTVPPAGDCDVPAVIRFVGPQAVVAIGSERVSDLRRGDVIISIDGKSVATLLNQWQPFYAASNEAATLRDVARNMFRGACGNMSLDIQRGKARLPLNIQRIPKARGNLSPGVTTHDLAGDTFRLLSPDVAYLKLSSIKASDVAGYIKAAANTKGLIVDIRNYPSEFVVFALGDLLVDRDTSFARFTNADLSNPGTFTWHASASLTPEQPHYAGKVVVLIDEVSQSQAEYTAMALRSARNAVIVGNTTAGADGNVSAIRLPGGQRTAISGIGIFYPDKRPTQRVGIVPDIVVVPTIDDFIGGVDAPLERAKQEIVGEKAGLH
jgi:C-terminal processing protease CtpA/Prc